MISFLATPSTSERQSPIGFQLDLIEAATRQDLDDRVTKKA
jgi:hypothetical protein